jgi:hypothetical protein
MGYAMLGMARHEGESRDWFHQLDPPRHLVPRHRMAGAGPRPLRARQRPHRLARLIRGGRRWRGIERVVAEVMRASQDHQLPVDDGELMLLVAGLLEAAGLDQRKLARRAAPRGPRWPMPGSSARPGRRSAAARPARGRGSSGAPVVGRHRGRPAPRSTAADALREGCTCRATPPSTRAPTRRSCSSRCTWHSWLRATTCSPTPASASTPGRSGFAADSPLAAVADVLLVAGRPGIGPDTVLHCATCTICPPSPNPCRR